MFDVKWKRTALDRLTEIWLASSDRSEITAAVAEIDGILASDPESAGESRDDSVRILFVAPLGVFFEVQVSKNSVYVLRTWTF